MKKLISILVLVFSLVYTSAFAETLRFGWDYSLQDQKNIEGFRLYRDGQTLENVVIPPEARTVVVERQTDKQSHCYHLVAFSGKEESDPSRTALDSYVLKIQTVGNITIEVLHD